MANQRSDSMETVKAILLPFKKKMTQTTYLLHRELIPAWDQDKDLCGICIEAPLDILESTILQILDEKYGYVADISNLLSLGVSAGDRNSSEVYYLYTIDLTKAKTKALTDEKADHYMVWTTDDILLESIDAQLTTCYARAKFLII